MKALVDNSEQGTVEWLKVRIPYVTASNVADVMAKGQGVTRKNYMVRKLCESLTGQPAVGYKSRFMQNGNDNEPLARRVYEMLRKVEVEQTGFWYLPDEKLGASTDGIVNRDGLIEIKNVIPAEHTRLLTGGKIKDCYIKQMQTQMYVLDRQWVDFISQCLGDEEYGELPDEYKYHIIRVERDDDIIEQIRSEVAKFHTELEELKAKLIASKGVNHG